jgi:hypothetical protein
MASVSHSPAGKDDLALRLLLPAHPEHYALPPYREGIVKVIGGGHMARIRIEVDEAVPDSVMEYADPSFPMKKPTVGHLDTGEVLFYILHEFRDTEDGTGCDCRLRLLFPEAAPQVFVDDHAEHLAVEFRSSLRAVWEDLYAEDGGGMS